MKTIKRMSREIRKAHKRARPRASATHSTLVRDLMKPIYLFGQHAPQAEWITDRKTARAKIAARENFYLRAGERLYFANALAYAAMAIPRRALFERIDALLA